MGKQNLNKLLEQTQQLTSYMENKGYMMQRNVEQIDETTRKLVSKSANVQSVDAAKNKAHYFLASKGLDAEKMARNLNAINLKKTLEPIEPIAETDIDAYLKHEHDLTILTAIEETKKDCINRFEQQFQTSMEQDWENTKQELLEVDFKSQIRPSTPSAPLNANLSFGLGYSSFDQSQQLQFSSPSLGRKRPYQPLVIDNKMAKYLNVINTLIEHKKMSKSFKLLSAFEEVTASSDDRDSRKADIVDSWEILKCMLREDDLKEQAYLDEYLMNSKRLRRQFVKGAKYFLEQQYARKIRTRVTTNPLKAMVGPVPAFDKLVLGFLNIECPVPHTELEMVGEYPIWGVLYYCLRCGQLQTAREIINSDKARTYLAKFAIYFEEYFSNESGRLSDNRWSELLHEYKLFSRSPCDPFKVLVYNIIGRCEPNKSFPTIIKTTQDFMWLRLSMIREDDSSAPLPLAFSSTDYPLSKLQEVIVHYGSQHFSQNGRQPLLYFQVLLLSQQFELAIQYLNSIGLEQATQPNQYAVDSVHFAIALHYAGVLRPSYQKQETQAVSVDLEKLLRHYVAFFSVSDPVAALNYYTLIRDPPALPIGVPKRRIVCIRDLLLETREFDLLLGDGVKKGKLYELFPLDECREIIETAANESDVRGRYDDAVILYLFSENFDKMLEILNNQLGRVLVVKSTERDRVVDLGWLVQQRHAQFGILHKLKNRDTLLKTFETLLRLTLFFDLYTAGKFNDALAEMERLDLIPFDVQSVDKKVDNFKQLDHSVKKNFSDILLSTMDILHKLYNNLKASTTTNLTYQHADGGRDQKMQELRAKAKVLIMFSGLIQFRMPSDTNSRLLRMEVFMS